MSLSAWNKIYDPKTRRFVLLNGFIGKKILEYYVSNLNGKRGGGKKGKKGSGEATLIYRDGKKELWLASRKQRCAIKEPGFKGLCVIGPAGPGKPMPQKTVCVETDCHIPLTDNAGLSIKSIKKCVKKCYKLLEKHDRVVVYCSVGKNRSASIVCAFLMGQQDLPFASASDIVGNLRKKWYFAINKKTQHVLGQTNPSEFSKKILCPEKAKSEAKVKPKKRSTARLKFFLSSETKKGTKKKQTGKKFIIRLSALPSSSSVAKKTPLVSSQSSHSPDYFNHPQHDYNPTNKKNMDYSKIYLKTPPKYLYRALRPRDLFWLFKTGNIISPCANCDGNPSQNCCKVDAQYHISEGSKAGSLKGKYLSMSSDNKVTAFFCARTHKTNSKRGFSVNIDPKMSNSNKAFRNDNKTYKNKKDIAHNNWGRKKNQGRPANGFSGLFIKISTDGLNLIDKDSIKFKKGDPNKNFADAAKEVLIENMIPGKNIRRIFISKTKHKDDVVGENGIIGEHRMKRYKKNKAETTVVWTDSIKDILQSEFDKYNDDHTLVENQPWFKHAKFTTK